MAERERNVLYRCQACGKWSHAQRKPKHHKRMTLDPADDDVILQEEGHQEPDTGAWVSLFFVACGPFDTYEAAKVDDD